MSYEDFLVNINNQPLWCNKYIKFEGKTLLFKSWIEDCIVILKNVTLNNGILDVGFLANIIQEKFTGKLISFRKHYVKQKIDVSIYRTM